MHRFLIGSLHMETQIWYKICTLLIFVTCYHWSIPLLIRHLIGDCYLDFLTLIQLLKNIPLGTVFIHVLASILKVSLFLLLTCLVPLHANIDGTLVISIWRITLITTLMCQTHELDIRKSSLFHVEMIIIGTTWNYIELVVIICLWSYLKEVTIKSYSWIVVFTSC